MEECQARFPDQDEASKGSGDAEENQISISPAEIMHGTL